MTTKKKITISIVSICLLLVVGVVSVVAVFAALSNNTNSNVNVTYTATQISGSASASYGIMGDTNWTSMYVDGDDTKATSIDFSQTTEAVEGELSPAVEKVEITDTKTYAIFKYFFTNNSTQYNINLALGQNPVTASSNFTVKYHTSATDLTIANAYTALTTSGTDSYTATTVGVTANSVTGSQYVFVLVELDNFADDANFEAAFAWTLTQGDKVTA